MTHATRGWFVFWLVVVSLLLGGSTRWASGMAAVPYTRFAVCRAGTSVPVTARRNCLATGRLRLTVEGHRLRAVWTGGFGRRTLSRWTKFQEIPGSIRPVNAPGIGGPAGAFTVGPESVPTHGGNRAEVTASQVDVGGVAGSRSWYAWSTYFPRDLNPVPDQTWNVFTQFHETNADECHPNVVFSIDTALDPARLRLTVRGGHLDEHTCQRQYDGSWNLMPLRLGHWYDFVFGVGWSANPSAGSIELAVNGQLVIPRTRVANLYDGQGVYFKQGLYRAPYQAVSHLYQGGMTRFVAGPAGAHR
jgi:hypothetical protein